MKIQVLSAEIGSTTTVVSAFDRLFDPTPRFLGQGRAPTTVGDGDVRIGLEAATADLRGVLGADSLTWDHFYACSSAAGGLRMSVHGLVYDMTAKAGAEAALGAGANVVAVTSGAIRDSDIARLGDAHPTIILLTGGVDHGERDTALRNAAVLRDYVASTGRSVPVIYAGNVENQDEVRSLFSDPRFDLTITDNVYPKIDRLVVEPARTAIQAVFERHITEGPGMEHLRDLVDRRIMPVPGAVMAAAKALRSELGDLVVVDVGGATTDIHSVCSDSPELGRLLLAPEPEAKRTVEGDLGLYVNRMTLLDRAGPQAVAASLGIDQDAVVGATGALPPIASSDDKRALAGELSYHAARIAMSRHAGRFVDVFGMPGKRRYAEGKDLTGVQTVIGTGGGLARLDGGATLHRVLADADGRSLAPTPDASVFIDTYYIMAAVGAFLNDYPDGAKRLLLQSLRHEIGPEPEHREAVKGEPQWAHR